MSLSKYIPIAAVSALLGGLVVVGATPRPAMAQQTPAPVQQPVQVSQPLPLPAEVAPQPAEQRLDTSAPIFTTNTIQRSKIRTTPEESLPKWVPKKGRLSVVDSSDLAENLGLVPKGTTKKSDERISVEDKLNEERAARAASAGNGAKDPNNYATSFSYSKAGRVRSRL